MPTVAYQGESGAYSEQASFDFFGPAAQPQPRATFDAVFADVTSGACDHGVVPLENSLAGSIHRNYDLLMRHPLHIIGEVIVRVSHNLIALPDVPLHEIRRVISHWQALDQCEQSLSKLLPGVERVQVYDTAGSVKMLAEEQRRDTAAIASRRAAALYGLPILREAVEDDSTNYTRFAVLGRRTAVVSPDTPCKTSIVFATRNAPGSLFRALAVFALRDIDLTKIESRPLQGSPWEYLFYLDFAGNEQDAVCARALDHLHEQTTILRVLGSYARARDAVANGDASSQ
jgi:prephenate dehydratase